MTRITSLVVLCVFLSSCGVLVDAVSDAINLDVEADLIKPADIGDASAVQPLSMSISLSATNPSFTLPPDFPTEGLSAILFFDAEARLDGSTENLALSLNNLVMAGDFEADFDVRVFSRNGHIWGQDLTYEPATVSACTFTLNPDTATGVAFATAVGGCIADWVDANGVPDQFDMEVTMSQGSPARQTGVPTTVVGDWGMDEISHEVSVGCGKDFLGEFDDTVVDNHAVIDCGEVTIQGTWDSSHSVLIWASARVFDGAGAEVASGVLPTTNLAAGNGTFQGNDAGVSNSQDLRVTLSDAFVSESLNAAVQDGSFGRACWYVKGPFPRTGNIHATLVGTCKFK